MNELAAIAALWRDFMQKAEQGALHVASHLRPTRRIRIIEDEPDRFRADGGDMLQVENSGALDALLRDAEVDVVLHPSRVLCRRLPLPAQARDFIASIVAGQLDRLMPWPAGAMHHGCRIAREGAEGLDVVVAAMGAADLAPILQKFAAHAPRSLRILACEESASAHRAHDLVLHDSARAAQASRPLRRRMELVLAGSAALSILAAVVLQFFLDDMRLQQERLSARQAGLRSAMDGRGATAESIVRLRKAEDRSVTLTLDSLAELVPDDTFLTSLDVTGSRLAATGQSRDANALIGVLERSGRFSEARFLAPTVRDILGVEQFQVEAKIAARRSPE